ncbi:NAD(P)-dependent dehydrogenase (short-subunit alcohol dehydrogenase family) [Solirubrobacter pauli]|uniref:NAD(P)-dependent dehydrogenase (Short-subunit alcohol dehydrogenase family) n=1 Tax=Solirubrobacter pauli TaxID=166793 RepID=A0A660L3P5_9ACTN|nr:SDR family oxidoreductase [Solirubrobacter pauli]RKQ87834.1 NAD(P)-dependent dehydrogenase (short-subunit alcohol dehydrogenase family) [Solirubrobacter pauli]
MAAPERSFVVTGGAGGIGRAIAARLDGHVEVLDLAHGHDAADEAVATAAATRAEAVAPLAGWVNNAAVFRDAWLHEEPVLDLITANLALAVTGCRVAVRHWLEHGRAGAIVNVSSHQAARPVPGALPYAVAKAAVEGLTRAVAVDYGPRGIRCNAVALGSIATARSDARPELAEELERLHPLGRVGTAEEVADVVAALLAPGFVSGAVLPVDGGRSALGHDPEARRLP